MNKRYLQAISKANSLDEKNFTLDFVMTKEISDHSHDIVDVDSINLDTYMLNPVVLPSHNHSAMAVGKVIEMWKEVDPESGLKQLVGRVKFAVEEYELAKTYWNLYKGGYMSAVSIGFIPKAFKDEASGATRLMDCEIIELSLVAIPANKLALAKSAGIDIKPVASLYGASLIKEIRDTMIELKDIISEIEVDEKVDAESVPPTDTQETPEAETVVPPVEHEPVVVDQPNHKAIAIRLMNKAIKQLGKK